MVGFLGSFHCLGMCGPLVLAYSMNFKGPGNPAKRPGASAWHRGACHHLAFHAGRIGTYAFLGALAGGVTHLAQGENLLVHLRGGVLVLGGGLMILAGMVLLRILPVPSIPPALSFAPGSFLGRLFYRLFQSKGTGARMALGLVTGFLPCMLSWAMIIKAATTQSAAGGFFTMTFFGLGTVPALFGTGLSASMLSMKMRFLGERVAAMSITVMGLILVIKGVPIFV